MDQYILKLIKTVYFYSKLLNRAGYRVSSILIIKITADFTLLIFYLFQNSRQILGKCLSAYVHSQEFLTVNITGKNYMLQDMSS